jgi:hypothetical protein
MPTAREKAATVSPLSTGLLFLLILQLSVCFADSSVTVVALPSPTSPAPMQTHVIQVGLADHKFQPDVVQTGVGDVSTTVVDLR